MAKRGAGRRGKTRKTAKPVQAAESYRHTEATTPLRPEVGTQAQFPKKKRKAPKTYRYDSSLSPSLDWDENPARELGEWLLRQIEEASRLEPPHVFPKAREFKGAHGRVLEAVGGLQDAVAALRSLGEPFLNWAGKAERMSFDAPTLPLFVHERLSTKAIVETLKSHRKDKGPTQRTIFELFADPQHPVADQVLKAYEYQDEWVNRLILGDSLVVMNSLLHYEGLGGQVQMIYMDPPYGVKFGSNFQPFVRQRDVKHNDDDHFTREPEMVQAYRDTWELGLHSYLSYMRDRIVLAHRLLHPSGSLFVQISDENVHHVREVVEDVFGVDNFLVTIFMRKKGSQRGNEIRPINDHILWFARNKPQMRRRFLYDSKLDVVDLSEEFKYVEMPDRSTRATKRFTPTELEKAISGGARLYVAEPLTSGGEFKTQLYPVKYEGRSFRPPSNNSWKFNEAGMQRIIEAGRIHVGKNQIRFKKYHTDFPYVSLSNMWADLAGASEKIYVVQTTAKAVQRCLLMTTDPGDLVLDPTCGSGTTAFVAEEWGRRWITIDISRVPLALARQRLLAATFPWYLLREEVRGPSSGFRYERIQDSKGNERGGLVPHITSTTIANDAEPVTEILVDRPSANPNITRVTGPFVVEATIPTPMDWDDAEGGAGGGPGEGYAAFVDRMIEVLRRSPVIRVEGNRKIALKNVRAPAKTLSLSAEATVAAADAGKPKDLSEAVQEAAEASGKSLPFSDKRVAIVFGPENGAVTERLVWEAAREAAAKNYAHLYVIGFAIQPNARKVVDGSEEMFEVPATYVQATPDLVMGDLLKNMRSSQIFSVCGLPEIELRKAKAKKNEPVRYEVELLGMDTFDPSTMENEHVPGSDAPAWFLDTDYNGLCFHVSQAFFPRTGAWESLKKALKATHEESVWEHLAGTVSAPFEPGDHGQVAVKVIDQRGNELIVTKPISEAE